MMNIPRFLSHLLFFYVLMGEPIAGELLYRSLINNLPSQPKARINYYYGKLSIYWMWVALIILIGMTLNLSEPVIWLSPLNDKGWLLTALVLITGGLLFFLGFRGKPSLPFQNQTMDRAYLPNTRVERLFYSVTALSGRLSEELIYRGFIWFYLRMVFPQLPVWVLVLISALVFAAGHYYQDRTEAREKGFKGAVMQWRRVAGTTAFGLLFGIMAAICGSLIPSILLHFFLDLIPIMTRPTAGEPLITPGHEQPRMSRES
jgi:uncharacterized protein